MLIFRTKGKENVKWKIHIMSNEITDLFLEQLLTQNLSQRSMQPRVVTLELKHICYENFY